MIGTRNPVIALIVIAPLLLAACGKKGSGKGTGAAAAAAGAASPILHGAKDRARSGSPGKIAGALGREAGSGSGRTMRVATDPVPVRGVRREGEGVFQNDRDGAGMVWVPPGFYPQGRGEGPPEEGPAHEVFLDGFYLYTKEVTLEMFASFLEQAGLDWPGEGLRRTEDGWAPVEGQGDEPVTGVTWEEATMYAAWAGGSLPSEAQWEAAARGNGSDPFPWGAGPPDESRCNCAGVGPGRPVPAGSRTPGASPFGCLDMAGNAAEWCQDTFRRDAYARRQALSKEPLETAPSTSRSIRGGGFVSPPEACRVTARTGLDPRCRMAWLGFRVVVVPKEK